MTMDDLMQKRRTSTMDAQINENLKKAYEDVLNEDVPDRLTQLLEKLKAGDAAKSGSDGGSCS